MMWGEIEEDTRVGGSMIVKVRKKWGGGGGGGEGGFFNSKAVNEVDAGRHRATPRTRERVLFIGTRFSNLCTTVDLPAKAA
jgi:hypothetical protein